MEEQVARIAGSRSLTRDRLGDEDEEVQGQGDGKVEGRRRLWTAQRRAGQRRKELSSTYVVLSSDRGVGAKQIGSHPSECGGMGLTLHLSHHLERTLLTSRCLERHR